MSGAMFLAVLLAQATPAPAAADSDIVVTGSREAFRVGGRTLRAAQATFAHHRGEFAPASVLRFVVDPRDDRPLSPLPRLRLTDGTRTLPIDVQPDGSFALPATIPDTWWLEADRPARRLSIKPLVLSPGSSRHDQRLGDARLQCRVQWAMAKTRASLLAAPLIGMVDLAGACSSRRIGLYARMPRPIRHAMLSEGGRAMPLALARGGRSYRLPLSDRSFGNEARMTITMEDAPRAPAPAR